MDGKRHKMHRYKLQQEQEQEEAEELSSFKKRPMKEDFKEALKLLGLRPWTSFACVGYMKQLEAARTRNFRTLMIKYSMDKIGMPNSDNENPTGEDFDTRKKKTQAWTRRVQDLVNAKDQYLASKEYDIKTRKDEHRRWF